VHPLERAAGVPLFVLRLPDSKKRRIVRPTLRVFVNGVPAGTIVFQIVVTRDAPSLPSTPLDQITRSFRRPFLSYASQDQAHVLRAAQLLRALHIECFQDMLTLSPGERWQKRLYREIENCDVFLLFWSNYARKSEWVISEAEYAYKCAKSAPPDRAIEIIPILLEGPPPPPPPDRLRGIHFNDPLRYVIFAEELTASKEA
jgi:TIR domain-containing protein